MSVNSTKITKSVTLIPNSGSVVSEKGEIAYNSATDKIEAYVGTASANILTDSHTGDVTINGNETVTGNLSVSGNAAVVGTLSLTGQSNLAAASAASLTANALTVNGNETVTGTLGVSGAVTLGSTLNVTGNEVLTGTLTVNNNATVTGTLSVSGAETLGGALTVNNNATITGNLNVSGSVNTNSFYAASGRTASATPPAAGYYNIYPKTDNKLYIEDSAGTEYLIGPNTGGASQYGAIVANPAIAGFSTHTSITAAIASVTAGQSILVTKGTYAENVTLDKQLFIDGMGRGSVVSGNFTVSSSASYSTVENLKITGTLTLSASSYGNIVDNCFVLASSAVVDNNENPASSNYLFLIEE